MNQNTIQMMKLFQENVKKDISNTNSVIKLVQEKLKDCDLNLNFLKQISKELNIDFANIESKLDSLESQNNACGISRENSLQSLADAFNDYCVNEALKIKLPGNGSEMEDLENSYINVTINQDGTLCEEANWAKRSSISSTGSMNTISSEENSNDADYGTTPSRVLHDYAEMNNDLIKMLLQNSKLPNGN
ncbi:hypothetical protein BpHYR1_038333 [Brachionus plicatilis]|uniref:Uncharacterized protein n=1 Tax=Brachionus plicatilis TaxID=10195 RepID=A0A3M7RDN4_BRAPC|nr:hypothetical protein BpHYR1_038333 [Brachionus plicatilis]